jgi:hypothetical protein
MREEALKNSHPPKPRLALRVGITGQWPSELTELRIRSIKAQLTRIFLAIEEAAKDILTANAAVYANERPQFRLVSDFSEGVNRLDTLPPSSGWLIEAILPSPKEEYIKGLANSAAADGDGVRAAILEFLKSAANVTEMPSPKPQMKDRGYVTAAGYLLRQIDLLIALWDGTQVKPGETGAIAKKAHEGGIPVIWLSTIIERPPRLIADFDEKGGPIASEADCTEGPLISALKPIFDGPSVDPGHFSRAPQDALIEYYRETWRSHCCFIVYDFLTRIASLRRPRAVIRLRPFVEQGSDWNTFFHSAPSADKLVDRIRQVLLPRFVWADTLAVYFSHHYRSAYVLAYLLSAVAVFISLGGAFAASIEQKVIFVFLEFIVIGSIIGLILLGRHWCWHERWLDYRALAESLRHGRFLAFLSEFGRIHDGSSRLISRMPLWTLWYVRATMRELGLPSAVLDSTYQWRILDTTLHYEIEQQIKYHKENHHAVHCVDSLLHKTGVSCFLITFLILALFLLGFFDELAFGDIATLSGQPLTRLGDVTHFLKPWMLLCTAGLPALGAALAGIRVHGDFESSEQRSALTIDSLTSLKADYEAALRREGDLDDTAERLIAASRVMSEDLAAWEELYGRKRLVLPA